MTIKQSKIKLVLKQFEEQLKVDADAELKKQQEIIEKEYEKKISDITKQKSDYLERVEELKLKLKQNIEFFNMVLSDLDVKSKDLETCYGACVEYVKKEKRETEANAQKTIEKHIAGRLKTFENYISTTNQQ